MTPTTFVAQAPGSNDLRGRTHAPAILLRGDVLGASLPQRAAMTAAHEQSDDAFAVARASSAARGRKTRPSSLPAPATASPATASAPAPAPTAAAAASTALERASGRGPSERAHGHHARR